MKVTPPPDHGTPEKRAARRAFGRAAATYDTHAVLQREVGRRLLEHLDPIRIDPARILDLGCGTGLAFEPLRQRFPRASLVGLDFAPAMLAAARARTPWSRRLLGRNVPLLACGDAERLPLAAGVAQLAFSNLMLQWCDASRAFAEVARVLPAGGLFLFSTYGPDTLKELRTAFASVDEAPHVNRFVDMHDLGDALVAAGFADPVMEMEVVTLEYASVEAMARDLQAGGGRNALAGRPRGLMGKGRWKRVVAHYESQRRGEVLPATYEIVYGHAWKVAPKRTADGRQIIDFKPRSAR